MFWYCVGLYSANCVRAIFIDSKITAVAENQKLEWNAARVIVLFKTGEILIESTNSLVIIIYYYLYLLFLFLLFYFTF